MKGIVFTEFLDMVEKKYGYEVVDHIIEASNLESEGIYTSVGTYSHMEIIKLLTNLSEKVEVGPQVLLKTFGQYIFDTFLNAYPQFFNAADNAFDFLLSVDDHIHVEVLKLYPDARLPEFESKVDEDGNMEMLYKSDRKMAAFAEGLIEKSLEYFNEDCVVRTTRIIEDGSVVKFTIVKQ